MRDNYRVRIDEALTELGIDAFTTRDEARRAYLRLLKTRKPETDPEGFRRLREAFELAREYLPEERQPWWSTRDTTSAATATDEEDAHHHEFEQIPLHENENVDERGDVGSGHDESVYHHESEQAILHENENGDTCSASELEAVPNWYVVYHRASESNSWRDMAAAFDLAARHIDSPEPPVTAAMRMLFLCLEQGDYEGFFVLKARFEEWLESLGRETRVIRGERVTQWVVLRELGDLVLGWPRPLVESIARVMREGSLTNAKADFEAFCARAPKQATAAVYWLRLQAPFLSKIVGPWLDTPEAPGVPLYPFEEFNQTLDEHRLKIRKILNDVSKLSPPRSNKLSLQIALGLLATSVLVLVCFWIHSSSSSHSSYNTSPSLKLPASYGLFQDNGFGSFPALPSLDDGGAPLFSTADDTWSRAASWCDLFLSYDLSTREEKNYPIFVYDVCASIKRKSCAEVAKAISEGERVSGSLSAYERALRRIFARKVNSTLGPVCVALVGVGASDERRGDSGDGL